MWEQQGTIKANLSTKKELKRIKRTHKLHSLDEAIQYLLNQHEKNQCEAQK